MQEILTQLPTTIPDDKIILIIGPQDVRGLGSLKKQIAGINESSRKEWVRGEFRNQVSDSVVTDKVCLVMTTVGTRLGAKENVRTAAGKKGIPYIGKALSIGEAKQTLNILSQVKSGKANSPAIKFQTNGVHAKGNGYNGYTPDVELQSTPEEIIETQVDGPTSAPETKALPIATRQPDDSVIEKIDTFVNIATEMQLAIVDIVETNKALLREKTELQDEVTKLRGEINNLREYSRSVETSLQEVKRSNTELITQNAHLQSQLDTVASIIGRTNK